MAVCDVVNEYGTLDDRLISTVIDVVAGAGHLAQAIVMTIGMSVGDAGTLSDQQMQVQVSIVAEHGTVADGYDQTGAFDDVLSAHGRLSDATKLAFKNIIEESGTLSDATSEAQPFGALRDSARISDAFSPAVLRMSRGERGRLSDAIISAKTAALSDSGRLSDGTVQTMRVGDLITEHGVITDALVSGADTGDVLRESMRAADAAVGVLHAAGIIAEHATIADFVPADVGGAWSSPLDTFAMSRWETAPFNSIAEIDGVLYVASSEGLYRMGAQHEEPEIKATIRGGLSDMGSPALKHASYFYAGYQSEGTLAVTVGYIPNGAEESFTYELPVRPATDPTPGRAKLGRGMRSRYWRFTFENVDGSDFTIFDRRFVVDSTSRRV